MEEAKGKGVDQWISNAVFEIVRRTVFPSTRIMAMIWAINWEGAPEGTTAKARLVAKGFTDPGLLTIRAEALTLSKVGRHCLLQLACSHMFKLDVCNVATAFWQRDQNNRTAMFTWYPRQTFVPG